MYGEEIINKSVLIYFDDCKWYPGVVKGFRHISIDENGEGPYNEHFVVFQDGDRQWFDLAYKEHYEEFKWPEEKDSNNSNSSNSCSCDRNRKKRKVSMKESIRRKENTPNPSSPTSKSSSISSNEARSTISHQIQNDESETKDKINKKEQEDTKGKIKTEQDIHLKATKKHRIYGDRMLLDRASAKGMMKLGGGNCVMFMYPKNDKYGRFESAIGHDMAVAYSNGWNFAGPKYAGQCTAAVSIVPHGRDQDRNLIEAKRTDGSKFTDEPFHVFMRRCRHSTSAWFGWEYCGKYRYVGDEDITMWASASMMSEADRQVILRGILDGLKNPNSYWHNNLEKWNQRLGTELSKDKSKAAPQYLKERRRATEEEAEADKIDPPSLAARARVLGYRKDLNEMDLANILVWLDEFHKLFPIEFVEYDENMYDFVKAGESTRNNDGKKRKGGEGCALASDFYNFCDQMI